MQINKKNDIEFITDLVWHKSTENNSFSSAQFEGSKLIEEGVVYTGTADKIVSSLLKFKYKSPYFIPG